MQDDAPAWLLQPVLDGSGMMVAALSRKTWMRLIVE